MSPSQTILVLGGTGRTGGRVVTQLLARGVRVRAVVRSEERLPAGAAGHPHLTLTVADLLALADEDLAHEIEGCDAVISCLGHCISARGIFGPPRDLVTQATERVYRALRAARPERPVRLIVMSSVSVNRPGGQDARRGVFERLALWVLRGLVPPTKDNQDAADFLLEVAGTADPYVQWSAVRPDTLREGDVTEYAVHEGLVNSLARPADTNRANVAHFMCELATDDRAWTSWQGKSPVIVNAPA